MTPKEHLIAALKSLCAREGGYVVVADEIEANDQTIWQIINDVKLPSGNPRGVGPGLQEKLDARYPGWANLSPTPATSSEEFTEVKHANVRFANGHGQVFYEDDDKPPLAFRTDFLHKLGIKAGNAVVVEAGGVSNEPKIADGAVVLVNRGDREHLRGDFFAFRSRNKLLIKRLDRLPDEVGILATAENSNFKPKTKIYVGDELDDFEVIGKAVWTGSVL